MDLTPALLNREQCLQDGLLVRLFGRLVPGNEPDLLRMEDLLHVDKCVDLALADGCALPEMAAIVRVTGPWRRDGTVEAYEMVAVEDAETLRQLQNRELLRLLEFQASSAYKIARTRLRGKRHSREEH